MGFFRNWLRRIAGPPESKKADILRLLQANGHPGVGLPHGRISTIARQVGVSRTYAARVATRAGYHTDGRHEAHH